MLAADGHVKLAGMGCATVDPNQTAPCCMQDYCSPEVFSTSNNPPPAADFWALGIIIFKLLSGLVVW